MFHTTAYTHTTDSRPAARRRLALTGAVLSVGVLLAACGDDSDSTQTGSGHDMGSMASSSGMPVSPSASATATASPTGSPASGPHNEADVAFATGMVPHHGQAVAMAELAESRAASAEVKEVAAAIKAAQGPEIEQLSGWLAGWGAPVPAADEMAMGMDHGSESMDMGGMAGMMTAQQMAALEKASGTAFDRMWLRSMVVHHQGAVAMSQAELKQGVNRDAKALAQGIIRAQQSEITTMTELIAG